MGFVSVVESLSFYSLYSSKMSTLEKDWSQANQNFSLRFALNILFLCAIFSSILLFLFCAAIFSDLTFSFGVSLILFSIFLLAGFKLPKALANNYTSKVNSDLHLALRAFSLNLSINRPFEKIITDISKSNYSCSPLFVKALNAFESGKSIPQSLAISTQYCNSLMYARSIQALTLIYERGSGAQSLDYICDEIIQSSISDVRSQASKSALFGLVFVAVSSLFPAFFLILNVAAGPFLSFNSDALSIWIFYILILPSLVFFVLVLMLIISPSLLSTVRQKQLDLEVDSQSKNSNLGFFARPYFESKILSQITLAESELAQMLLAGAAASKFSVEQMLEFGAKSPSVYLCARCSEALSQIRAGTNPSSVISNWEKETPSLIFSRALSLILVGYTTGASLRQALETAASDMMSSFNLVRERASLLSLQNYTLIGASAILVPVILAVSLSFSSQISEISPIGEIYGVKAYGSAPLISAAQFAIPIYLVINCVLAAAFISTINGARHKFLAYAISLSILCQLVWFVVLSSS